MHIAFDLIRSDLTESGQRWLSFTSPSCSTALHSKLYLYLSLHLYLCLYLLLNFWSKYNLHFAFDLIRSDLTKSGQRWFTASLPEAAAWSMINVGRELQRNKHCNQIIIAILAIILTLDCSWRGLILTMLTFTVFLFYIHRPFFHQTHLSLPSSSSLLDRKLIHWGLMTANDAIVSCDGPALYIGYTHHCVGMPSSLSLTLSPSSKSWKSNQHITSR